MMIERRTGDLLSAVELSPPEAAYLADRGPRAIGATLAGLTHMGLIEFREDGRVVPAKPAPARLTDPILRSVLDFVSTSEGPSSVEDVEKAAEPATEDLRQRLQALGLLLDETALWLGGVAIAGASLSALVAILLLLAANGHDISKCVLPGLSIVVPVTVWLVSRRHRTRHGNAVLKRLQDENVALKESAEHAPVLLTPTDLAQAVAIYGPAVLEGGPLDDVGRALKPKRNGCGACGGCGGCGGCA
jgi:uncharacterized protein (TIGR04222 family)